MSETGTTTTSSFMSMICAPCAATDANASRVARLPGRRARDTHWSLHQGVSLVRGRPVRTDGCPRPQRRPWEAAMEYLVTMTTRVPDDVSEGDVADVREREAAHTRELARAGRVLRLWRPPLAPGEWRTIGLFVADGPTELEQILAAMPL